MATTFDYVVHCLSKTIYYDRDWHINNVGMGHPTIYQTVPFNMITRDVFPDGWQILYDDVHQLQNCEICKIEYRHGYLHITPDKNQAQLYPDARYRFVRYITNGIKTESTRMCLCCGGKAVRRKEIFGDAKQQSPFGKPPLCLEHYLHYLNKDD